MSTLQFKIIANDLRIRIKSDEGVLINFDPEGVQVVNDYISQRRQELSQEDLNQLVNSVACFLGETVLSIYGGKWKYFHDYQQWGITFGGSNAFYPVHIAEQQLNNLSTETIYSAFASLNLGVA